jgi:Na+/melibiose symporter-like transporter
MGDVASNAFLFIFYTDVFGLAPAAVGIMMLVTRLIDAFSDPLMGQWLTAHKLVLVNLDPIYYGVFCL